MADASGAVESKEDDRVRVATLLAAATGLRETVGADADVIGLIRAGVRAGYFTATMSTVRMSGSPASRSSAT